MTWLYQRAGQAFELEAVQDAVTGRYVLVWRYPSGRLYAESFPGIDVYKDCHGILTRHLAAMGWQCGARASVEDDLQLKPTQAVSSARSRSAFRTPE